ncbi:MAG: methyltransferase [Pseudomonadota bacterium]
MNAGRHTALQELAGVLAGTAALWRPAPFHDDPPWVVRFPALRDALLALDDAGIDALEHDPQQLADRIAQHIPEFAGLMPPALRCLDSREIPLPLDLPESLGRDVPGRKWQQTLHFAAACGRPQGTVLDWCCGKAHLGRVLARHYGNAVSGIERNGALCAAGRALAQREHLPVQLHQADVLRHPPVDVLRDSMHAVALHACGYLHLALLEQAAAAGVPALDLAPCCYHLTADENWQPLSRALAGTALTLSRAELRLAVHETATASARVTTQSRRLASWRLGFDRLQRTLRGIDEYLPTPSRPARVLRDGFAAFCRDLAAHHRIALPAGTDFTHWENTGRQRLARVRRLELVRHAVRRPLEILLVTDRALWLEDHGYEVSLRLFCPPGLTPRNLLVRARRSAA